MFHLLTQAHGRAHTRTTGSENNNRYMLALGWLLVETGIFWSVEVRIRGVEMCTIFVHAPSTADMYLCLFRAADGGIVSWRIRFVQLSLPPVPLLLKSQLTHTNP
jgi:hypothetical protein